MTTAELGVWTRESVEYLESAVGAEKGGPTSRYWEGKLTAFKDFETMLGMVDETPGARIGTVVLHFEG